MIAVSIAPDKPSASRFAPTFQAIYSTDLVYAPDCWKLCGDAHCCNFGRYKTQMHVLGKSHNQELPLLPGEMDFIRARGWAPRFGSFEHRVIDFPLAAGTMKLEFLVGGTGSCLCPHDARTTVCRLYPLWPVFDLNGRTIDIDKNFGIFDEIEQIDSLERACKITAVPLAELSKFLAIATAIASNPTQMFYVMAFHRAKAHAVRQLRAARATLKPGQTVSTLRMFEGLFALKRLINQDELRRELDELAAQMKLRYGDTFTVA